MIRKNIIKNKNDKQRYFLNDSWRIEMPAVVRTPFYGNNCSEYFGYVVTYSEMEQAYHLLKVDLHNGKILWSIDAVNGGYGTPTVFGDLVVFLKEFDAVQAVSAESGIVEWAVQGGHRVRTTLNTHVLAVVLSQPGGTPPEVSCKGAKPLAFVGGNALLVD